ncbi:MAG: NAD(P)H-binding protein [Myxococcales bacterium]|nr:NAD(P)H-binding protein [Myxococcales bacterium]
MIAGAGYVGGRLGELLAARGDEVFAVRRSISGLPPGVTPVAADLLDRSALAALPGRWDAVVFCAGPSESTREAYRRTYLGALGVVLDALSERSARFVFTSSTAVYAQTDGSWVDEASPAEATHFSGATLLEAEALLRTRRPDAVSLRLGGIYGPGRASLVAAVRRGEATFAEGDRRAVNRFHRDDCAGALAHLVGLSAPRSVYLGVDDEPASRRDVLCWIAQRVGAPAPHETPERAESARRGGGHKRCSNARLRGSGYALAFPTYREGYASVIDAELNAPAGNRTT